VRLVLGVLLVLVSVLVGARVVTAANSSVRVWAVKSDLAAGSVLTSGDLRGVRVRLFDNAGQYISTKRSPAGQTLSRDLGAGELLPSDALRPQVCGSLVNIPVSAQHLPDPVLRGQRIDVFATPKGGEASGTKQVLSAVTVQSAARAKGGLVAAGAQWSIAVRVPTDKASEVVEAIRTADIDIAVVSRNIEPEDLCGTPSATPSATPSGNAPDKPGGGAAPGSAGPGAGGSGVASPR